MQDIIKKIIEIDRMAQKMTDDALALKAEAEASVEEDKKKLREKYIERARRRIQITVETENGFLKETLEDISKKYDAMSVKLGGLYETGKDKWVDEIYNRVIGG